MEFYTYVSPETAITQITSQSQAKIYLPKNAANPLEQGILSKESTIIKVFDSRLHTSKDCSKPPLPR